MRSRSGSRPCKTPPTPRQAARWSASRARPQARRCGRRHPPRADAAGCCRPSWCVCPGAASPGRARHAATPGGNRGRRTRRRPPVAASPRHPALRPVYPGVELVDARFWLTGRSRWPSACQVALVRPAVSRARAVATGPRHGGMARLTPPGSMDQPATVVAPAPDGKAVAYGVSSSAATSTSLWPTSAATPGRESGSGSSSVYVAPLDGSSAPRRIFEFPRPRVLMGPGASA